MDFSLNLISINFIHSLRIDTFYTRHHNVEYAVVVWCPHYNCDTKLIESLQNRAARWICGVHPLIHGLSLLMIAVPSLIFLPFNPGISTLLFLSSMVFTIIIPPSISAITVISTAFLLPEVIICHYVHLNQPLHSFFANTVFWWNSVPLYILNDYNCKFFSEFFVQVNDIR